MAVGLSTLSMGRLRASGIDLLARGARSWVAELLALFPARIAAWLMDSGSKRLRISAEPDAVVLELLGESRSVLASSKIGWTEWSLVALDGFLDTHGLERAHVALGIRIAP